MRVIHEDGRVGTVRDEHYEFRCVVFDGEAPCGEWVPARRLRLGPIEDKPKEES